MTLQNVLNNYSFVELWRPDILAMVLLAATLYILLTGPLRKRLPYFTQPVSWGKKSMFLSGLLILYFVHGTPVNVLGYYYLFSAHMLQMAVSYMIAAPLLMIGIPQWGWNALLSVRAVKNVFACMTHPVVAVINFNAFLSFYHVPFVFDTVMQNHWLHVVYHTFLFVAACFMWWPIITPLPGEKQLSFLRKFGYIITGSVLITPVCALVIFAQGILYTTYIDTPQIFAPLPVLDDQQMGGVIMKLVQEGAFATALIIIFFQWVRNERSRRDIDPVSEADLAYLNTNREPEHQPQVLIREPSTERGN
ncbi:putative membrane protein [Caldalkalibacillus uzonensis]|uniref:Membrane protein n=1 Tax=Caldalkalibacillus uzonensis TaxID=353224 RepID=A0ABU0CLP8_9BACI|nr:cytochrome c oxidase assembly protein [Caldalkalibacillus uzonensis]MDQ0337344.1 putative membrane protein [Caldalkalibacillus uzonensis]